jgi:hypothetical protein
MRSAGPIVWPRGLADAVNAQGLELGIDADDWNVHR